MRAAVASDDPDQYMVDLMLAMVSIAKARGYDRDMVMLEVGRVWDGTYKSS